MDNCIFCKIIKGEIPSYKIYEDESTYAFLDISQDSDGHTLVISKKHYKNILDVDDEELFHIMSTVKKVSNHFVNQCGYDGVNIVANANEAAEQSVMHIHIHIFPRKNGNGWKMFNTFTGTTMTLEQAQEKLKLQ